MSDAATRLAEAEAAVAAARATLDSTVEEARRRLSPERLVADGRDTVRAAAARAGAGVADHVRARPGLYVAIGGLAALFLFRKPVTGLARRAFGPSSPPAPPYPGDRPKPARPKTARSTSKN